MKLTGAAAIVAMFDTDGMLDDPRLAEKVVNKHIVRGIAQYILNAAKIREDSYDQASADVYTGSNFEQFYTISLEEACKKTCPPGLGELIHLALDNCWNDTLEWAKASL